MKQAILAVMMMAVMLASPVLAMDPVKIGMITTLSTKAGYLGEEIRDDSSGRRGGGFRSFRRGGFRR
jgi:hypothetical protein